MLFPILIKRINKKSKSNIIVKMSNITKMPAIKRSKSLNNITSLININITLLPLNHPNLIRSNGIYFK